jgi:hypothetical protein
MLKLLVLLSLLSLSVIASSNEDISPKKEQNVKEKALFINKKHYDTYLERNIKNDPVNKKKELKIYKRKDGTIDTLKTINAANQ